MLSLYCFTPLYYPWNNSWFCRSISQTIRISFSFKTAVMHYCFFFCCCCCSMQLLAQWATHYWYNEHFLVFWTLQFPISLCINGESTIVFRSRFMLSLPALWSPVQWAFDLSITNVMFSSWILCHRKLGY